MSFEETRIQSSAIRSRNKDNNVTNGGLYPILNDVKFLSDNIQIAIPSTYSELSVMLSNGTATPYHPYLITDAGHRGIIVTVDSTGASTELQSVFLAAVPDYQNTSGDFAGIWSATQLAQNGDFDGDADWWTLGGGWSYGSDSIVNDGSDGTAVGYVPMIEAGKRYYVTFTVSDYVDGSVTPSIGDESGTAVLADGAFGQYITASGTGQITFTGADNFEASLSDVTVYDVTAYGDGKIVALNGLQYINITGNATDVAPGTDTTNWTLLTRATSDTYIKENYYCEYDFVNEWVQLIADTRGNIVGGSFQYEQEVSNGVNVTDRFRFGDNGVVSNYSREALLDIVNQPGDIIAMHLEPYSSLFDFFCFTTSVLSSGYLEYGASMHDILICEDCSLTSFTVKRGVEVANKSLCDSPDPIAISELVIGMDWTEVEVFKASISGWYFGITGSNAEATLDLDDADIFAAGVLTIPVKYDYVGIFTLTSDSEETIESIVNLPTLFPVKFVCANAESAVFSPTGIATAASGDIVSQESDITIEGRTNGSDEYVISKDGTLNKNISSIVLI